MTLAQLPLSFPGPHDEASGALVPRRLDALYRYPASAALGESWGLAALGLSQRRSLVAALFVYPPRASAFQGVTLTDETGRTFHKLGSIFVDELESELGFMNAVVGSSPVRVLAFFQVPVSVHQLGVGIGRNRLAVTTIAPTGTAYHVAQIARQRVIAAGWLNARAGSVQRFGVVVELLHHSREYDGSDLALSDSTHARETDLSQVYPELVLEVDEGLNLRELPKTPEVVPARLVLAVYAPDPRWKTPDWIQGLGVPPLERLGERLPSQTLRRIDQ